VNSGLSPSIYLPSCRFFIVLYKRTTVFPFTIRGRDLFCIFANDCGIIDTHSILDGNICGSYKNGTSVQCNAGTYVI
jgi:hypothetical protein